MLFLPELLRKHFCCFEVFSPFSLLQYFTFWLFFGLYLLLWCCHISVLHFFALFYHFRRAIKLRLPLISHLPLRLRSVQSHSTRKKNFLEKCWYFYSFGKYGFCVCKHRIQQNFKNPITSSVQARVYLSFYLTFLAVMLASAQACEWHNFWWSLCTMYMFWSCRHVWWHHRRMPGKCHYRKQWTWPTSLQYTCAIGLVTSETWNNQEEKSQRVTEEIFMLWLRISSYQDMISLTVKKKKILFIT